MDEITEFLRSLLSLLSDFSCGGFWANFAGWVLFLPCPNLSRSYHRVSAGAGALIYSSFSKSAVTARSVNQRIPPEQPSWSVETNLGASDQAGWVANRSEVVGIMLVRNLSRVASLNSVIQTRQEAGLDGRFADLRSSSSRVLSAQLRSTHSRVTIRGCFSRLVQCTGMS